MENELYQTLEEETESTVPAEAPAEEPAQTFMQKILSSKKLLDNKKLLAYAGCAVVAIVTMVVVISLFAKSPNKCTTPLDLEMAVKNAKTYKAYEKAQLSLSNGLANDEMKDLLAIQKKSDNFDEDAQKEAINSIIEGYTEDYGKNYKFYYEIVDKDKVSEHDLLNTADDLTDAARNMYNKVKDIKTADLEDMADEMGLKKSDVRKLKNITESYYKDLKKAKVTAGYEFEVTYFVKSSELSEPEKLGEKTIRVYKVDGKWVSLDNLDIEDLF